MSRGVSPHSDCRDNDFFDRFDNWRPDPQALPGFGSRSFVLPPPLLLLERASLASRKKRGSGSGSISSSRTRGEIFFIPSASTIYRSGRESDAYLERNRPIIFHRRKKWISRKIKRKGSIPIPNFPLWFFPHLNGARTWFQDSWRQQPQTTYYYYETKGGSRRDEIRITQARVYASIIFYTSPSWRGGTRSYRNPRNRGRRRRVSTIFLYRRRRPPLRSPTRRPESRKHSRHIT